MIHDAYCLDAIAADANMLVPWWIMAAWAYDVASDPILSDAVFDRVATELADKWDQITHRHKDRLDRAMLKSTLAIKGNYPTAGIGAAQQLIDATQSPPPKTPWPPLEDLPEGALDVVAAAIGDIAIEALPEAAQTYLRQHKEKMAERMADLAAEPVPRRVQGDLFGN